MQKFCMKCGAPLGQDGKCAKCGINNSEYMSQAQAKEKKPEKAKEKKPEKAKKRGSGKKVIIIVIAALLLIGVVVGVLFLTGVFKKKKKEAEGLKRPDARSYMKEYGSIENEIPVAETDNILTEAQAYEELTKRGFTGYTITAPYDMDGNLVEKAETSPDGTAKHPYYKLAFFSDNGIYWVVTLINGNILAQPFVEESANSNSKVYYFADTAVLTFYDSQNNAFFEIKPDTSKYLLKQQNRIDADLLNSVRHEEVVSK